MVLGNLWHGSSQEETDYALKGHGVVIAAKDFGRIVLYHTITAGLKVIRCLTIAADFLLDIPVAV